MARSFHLAAELSGIVDVVLVCLQTGPAHHHYTNMAWPLGPLV